jgi:sulfonate transport system ATP-binding protein
VWPHRRPHTGRFFQEPRLFAWLTVEDNVRLGLDDVATPEERRNELVRAYIALVGLAAFERAYPRQLSGGMAQRAAIARSLVSQPEILLLDEPFGALDSLTRSHMQDEILRIWERRRVTMLLITHDVEEAVYLSGRVLVMEPRPGRIRTIFPIDLPRPRDKAAPEFIQIREKIVRELRR